MTRCETCRRRGSKSVLLDGRCACTRPRRSKRTSRRVSRNTGTVARKGRRSASRTPPRKARRSASRTPQSKGCRSASRTPPRKGRRSVSRTPPRKGRRSASRTPQSTGRRPTPYRLHTTPPRGFPGNASNEKFYVTNFSPEPTIVVLPTPSPSPPASSTPSPSPPAPSTPSPPPPAPSTPSPPPSVPPTSVRSSTSGDTVVSVSRSEGEEQKRNERAGAAERRISTWNERGRKKPTPSDTKHVRFSLPDDETEDSGKGVFEDSFYATEQGRTGVPMMPDVSNDDTVAESTVPEPS